MRIEADRVDDEFAERLVAWDEVLAAGGTPVPPPDIAPDSENGQKLAKGLACLKLLRRVHRTLPRNERSDNETGDNETSANVPSSVEQLSQLFACSTVATNHTENCSTAPGSDATNTPRTTGSTWHDDKPARGGTSIVNSSRLGRFEIRRELGRGGYGVVFLAYDPHLCREIALKVPRAEALMEAGLRARFKHEARAAAGLEHPHIVPVFEAGDVGPVCYIASAFCPGINLAEWLRRNQEAVPCTDAAQLIAILADAIEHAHSRGVLHRDLKPANVILQWNSEISDERNQQRQPELRESFPSLSGCNPKITDFGLALTLEGTGRQTLSGAIMGTPHYMAPEQAVGRNELSSAADVYALGAMLYELLAGRVPFQGDSPLSTLQQVVSDDPLPPTRLRPSVPRDLETICLKCLQKDPHKRYSSALHLAEDLRRFLRDEPILARPTSLLERTWRWCRRRPLDAGLATTLFLAVFLGVAGVFWQWRKAEQRRLDTVGALGQLREAHRDVVAQRDRGEMMLYLHDVALAHHECLADNIQRADQLLEGCRPQLRNWEWYYLKQLCHTDLHTLEGHTIGVNCVSFSPDGQLIASCSGKWGIPQAGEVIVWDAQTGRALHTFHGHVGSISDLAFHPASKILATVDVSWRDARDGVARLWDLETGMELLKITDARDVFSVAFSPNGKLLALGGADWRVSLRNSTDGKIVRVLDGNKGNVFSVAFHPDGTRLATGCRDGSARIFDINTGQELFAFTDLMDVRQVAFSPDGRLLAIATFGGTLKIWDIVQGREVASHRSRPSGIEGIAFSPDGKCIAVIQRSGSVELWDTNSGRLERKHHSHTAGAVHAAFSPNGSRLATSGKDHLVRVWDLTAQQEPRTFGVQDPHIVDMTVVPNSSMLLLASGKNTAKQNIGIADYSLRLWDADQTAVVKTLKGHTNWVTTVAVSSDGRILASGSEDKTVRLWDATTGETLKVLRGHEGTVTSLVFAQDGKRLISASEDQTLKVWSISDGKEERTLLGHVGPVQCLACIPNSRTALSAGADGVVRAWDPVDGIELAKYAGHSAMVMALEVTSDGRYFASAGSDSVIHIWDAAVAKGNAGLPVPIRSLRGHDGQVTGLAFSADGTRLASTSADDDTVRLWDVAAGQEAIRLPSMGKPNAQVSFSGDEQRLFVSAGQHVRIFDARRHIATREERSLAAEERLLKWHTQQAKAAESDYEWFAAAWHLGQLIEVDPYTVQLRERRATANAEQERWSLAEEDFRVIEANKKQPSNWFCRALMRLYAGDMAGYIDACREMQSAYLPVDASTANALAWTAALHPQSETDPALMVEWADFAFAKARTNYGRYQTANTQALVLYRARRFDDAAKAMHQALEYQGSGGQPIDWLLLAMIHQSLGHESEASTWMEKATTAREPSPPSATKPGTWIQRIQHELFLREARATLQK